VLLEEEEEEKEEEAESQLSILLKSSLPPRQEVQAWIAPVQSLWASPTRCAETEASSRQSKRRLGRTMMKMERGKEGVQAAGTAA
jgi:hypothetical protein